MTRSEAHQIVIMLKLGRSFGVRFRDQDGELTYLGGGVFENRRAEDVGVPVVKGAPLSPLSRESMKEADLVSWLCRHYSFDNMMQCGRE
jgi:hypothetical protein